MLKIKLSNGKSVSVKTKSYLKMSLKDGSFAYIPKIINHIEEKAFNQISIKQFEGIYDDIDFYPEKPGCIMIDVEPLTVLEYIDNAEEDLVNETDMDYSPVPAENVSHVTLLYGLMENGNKWKNKVDDLLKGWRISEVTIDKVDYFDIGDSYAVIAKLKITPELREAHNRLLMLPNAQTFSEYLPHITLAYIKKDVNVKKWVNYLSKIYNGETIKTLSLNYGDEEDIKKNNHVHNDVELREDLVKANNALSDETNNSIALQQSSLQNSIQNLEGEMVTSMLSKIVKTKNKFDDQEEVLSKAEKEKYINELRLIVSAYYISLFPIYANQLIRKRATEFSVQVPFNMDKGIQDYITVTARRASQSHVNTIVEDILKTTKKAYEESLSDLEESLKASGSYTDAEIYKLAREKALEGASQQRIISSIKKKYQDVSQDRAKTIARTETNRAFTQSQFQADVQFLNSAGLMNKAYKKWETRSDNPCAYCIDLSMRGPIPFEDNFQDLGTEISSTFYKKDGTPVERTLKIDYDELSAGNAHVNCACRYVLVIENDSGDFINYLLDAQINYNPVHDKTGKFGSTDGGGESPLKSKEVQDKLGELSKRGHSTGAERTTYKNQLVKLREKTMKPIMGDEEYYKNVQLMRDWNQDSRHVAAKTERANKKALAGEKGLMTAEYQFAQAYYKKAGIKTVDVYRGISGKQGKQVKEALKLKQDFSLPSDHASSWSDDVGMAQWFATQHKDGLILKRSVPVKNIMSSYRTNPYLSKGNENEYILADSSEVSYSSKKRNLFNVRSGKDVTPMVAI